MTTNALYVGSVGKAFQVLDCFKSASGDLSLMEIMARSGLDKSAAQRYAYTLCAEGYLEQNPQTRRYRLGKGMLNLTFHFLRTHALVEALNPIMLDLSKATGEKISLSLRDGNELVHVMRHQTQTEHYHASLVGRRVPLYCTAGGRAVLSRLSDAELAAQLDGMALAAHTPKTLTSARAVKAEVKKAREQGYALLVDEFIVGEVSLGAAVTNAQGDAYGALHVAGSSTAWSGEAYAEKFAPFLLAAIAQFQGRNPQE
ncbi:IclR family transcriptional regulator [Achromobacter sp. Bel]|uniref:IclR family transcriptional regulator n=1 Tax=Achromobacter sp. Bel TaxID=2727415 RepID=UPI00145EFF43|nr:IclR family transcriptional regulator [Achromobacter sp. Bel]NMK49057.1 IclR family transcriptional regulator [Achromobacter sp. Bel]